MKDLKSTSVGLIPKLETSYIRKNKLMNQQRYMNKNGKMNAESQNQKAMSSEQILLICPKSKCIENQKAQLEQLLRNGKENGRLEGILEIYKTVTENTQ